MAYQNIHLEGEKVRANINSDGTYTLDVSVSANNTGNTVTITPTISASPDYSVGDVIGGIQTIALANFASGLPTKLQSLAVIDKTGASPQFTVLLFKATPAGGTYTDNAALVIDASDLADFVGMVKVVAADWTIPVAGSGVAAIGGIGQILPVTATSLFALIIADATYNAASTSDLILTFGFERM